MTTVNHFSMSLVALISRVLLAGLLALITACSSVNTLVDEQAATMEEIFDSHTLSSMNDPVLQHREQRQHAANHSAHRYDFDPHFLSAKTHTDNLFHKLPNPVIYLYVKPHPAGQSGSPIPGYLTKFYLYDRDHFAQPGELIDRDVVADLKEVL